MTAPVRHKLCHRKQTLFLDHTLNIPDYDSQSAMNILVFTCSKSVHWVYVHVKAVCRCLCACVCKLRSVSIFSCYYSCEGGIFSHTSLLYKQEVVLNEPDTLVQWGDGQLGGGWESGGCCSPSLWQDFRYCLHSTLIEKLMRCGFGGWSARWVENWLSSQAQRAVIIVQSLTGDISATGTLD